MVRDTHLCIEPHISSAARWQNVVPSILLVPYHGSRYPEAVLYKSPLVGVQTTDEASIPALARPGKADSLSWQVI